MNNLPVIHWFDKNTIRHLRFSFSFFLLPVFLFALSQAPSIRWGKAFLAFVILHVLIFPSSNGYNSYQDRDESSIGGLKNPPKVTEHLFCATLLMDIAAILAGLFISFYFSFLLVIFIFMSRLYSFRGVRLKKYPFTGFLTVFIFQGAFVYLMASTAFSDFSFIDVFNLSNVICMAVASLFIGSMYPITQIYQHEADKKDGVISISYKLGYKGTFVFSAILFSLASALLFYYFSSKNQLLPLLIFFIIVSPLIFFLMKWFRRVKTNSHHADYESTMKANLLASVCMNLFFLILILNNRFLFF